MEAIKRFFRGPKQESIIIHSEDWRHLANGNNNVAVKVYRLLSEDDGNFVFCPYNVSMGIAMLLSAAEGQAATEMRSALRLQPQSLTKSIASIYPKYMLAARCKVPLPNFLSYPFNMIICRKDLGLKRSFMETITDGFWSSTLLGDIRNENEETIAQANALFSQSTNGLVPEVLESLDPESVMVLVDAIYFKGTLELFPKKEATTGNFYREGSSKQVEVVRKSGSFSMYSDESVDVLQIPFSNIQAAILIVLPRAVNGLESIETGLSVSFLHTILKNLTAKNVAVSIPPFQVEYTKSLIPCYRFLGIERILEPGGGLSRATESPDACLSEILHKVILEIDGNSGNCYCPAEEENQENADHEFVVDHPFAFAIYNTISNDILLMGRVSDP